MDEPRPGDIVMVRTVGFKEPQPHRIVKVRDKYDSLHGEWIGREVCAIRIKSSGREARHTNVFSLRQIVED